MFSWLGLLKAVLSIADQIAKICHDKQLLDAGAYKAVAKYNEDALNAIRDAEKVRASVTFDSSSLRNDPNARTRED